MSSNQTKGKGIFPEIFPDPLGHLDLVLFGKLLLNIKLPGLTKNISSSGEPGWIGFLIFLAVQRGSESFLATRRAFSVFIFVLPKGGARVFLGDKRVRELIHLPVQAWNRLLGSTSMAFLSAPLQLVVWSRIGGLVVFRVVSPLTPLQTSRVQGPKTPIQTIGWDSCRSFRVT